MINSIYSSSNYYALQSNYGLYNKSNGIADKNSLFYQNLLTNSSESTDSTESTESSDTAAYLPLDEHFGMMQSYQKAPAIPPALGEEDAEDDSDTASALGSIDADGDGTISADEYDDLMAEMGITNPLSADEFFAQYDTDEDGEITAAEMDAGKPANVPPAPISEEDKPAFSSDIDTDGDGSISTDEYEAYVTQSGIEDAMSSSDFFAAYDTDSDGELTVDEIKTAYDNYIHQAVSASGAYETNFTYAYDGNSMNFNTSI